MLDWSEEVWPPCCILLQTWVSKLLALDLVVSRWARPTGVCVNPESRVQRRLVDLAQQLELLCSKR